MRNIPIHLVLPCFCGVLSPWSILACRFFGTAPQKTQNITYLSTAWSPHVFDGQFASWHFFHAHPPAPRSLDTNLTPDVEVGPPEVCARHWLASTGDTGQARRAHSSRTGGARDGETVYKAHRRRCRVLSQLIYNISFSFSLLRTLNSTNMFASLTAIVALAMPLLAVATPTSVQRDGGSCNTGALQCCNSVQSVSSLSQLTVFKIVSLLCHSAGRFQLRLHPPRITRYQRLRHHWPRRPHLLPHHRHRCRRQLLQRQPRLLREQQLRECLKSFLHGG